MTTKKQLTPEIILAAIDGFEAQKRQLDLQIAELQALRNGDAPETDAEPPARKRKISAAGRARIVAAQRARWAKVKGTDTPAPAPKRKISAAGRKAIAAATKKRWAKWRKERGVR